MPCDDFTLAAGRGANVGPTLGYAPEKIEYGITCYKNETRRLYRVMDTHLQKSTSGFLVGDKCTIADMACWGWVAAHREFHHVVSLCGSLFHLTS